MSAQEHHIILDPVKFSPKWCEIILSLRQQRMFNVDRTFFLFTKDPIFGMHDIIQIQPPQFYRLYLSCNLWARQPRCLVQIFVTSSVRITFWCEDQSVEASKMIAHG